MAPRAAELFSLKGKTAFVTGASQGLGRRFAVWLAAEGANVVVAARNVANLEQVAAEIESEGGAAKVVSLDLTKDDSTLAAIDTAWNAFEGGVDIVVNNAGIGNFGPCLETSTEAFDEVMNINLRGAFVISREFAKRMVAAGKPGSIINVSSAAGDGALMWAVPYCASKAAMSHMTRAMARELGPKGIRVNALAPGYIVTDINTTFLNSPMGEHMASQVPLRRFGDIEKDLHGALLLLASDAGAYMTGSVTTVDGGVITGTITSLDPDWKDPA